MHSDPCNMAFDTSPAKQTTGAGSSRAPVGFFRPCIAFVAFSAPCRPACPLCFAARGMSGGSLEGPVVCCLWAGRVRVMSGGRSRGATSDVRGAATAGGPGRRAAATGGCPGGRRLSLDADGVVPMPAPAGAGSCLCLQRGAAGMRMLLTVLNHRSVPAPGRDPVSLARGGDRERSTWSCRDCCRLQLLAWMEMAAGRETGES